MSEEKDSIISCAEYIIENGELLNDYSQSRNIPSVTFGDDKGNTLYICWYSGMEKVHDIEINSRTVPRRYDNKIFKMAKQRTQFLQEKYLRETIESVRRG